MYTNSRGRQRRQRGRLPAQSNVELQHFTTVQKVTSALEPEIIEREKEKSAKDGQGQGLALGSGKNLNSDGKTRETLCSEVSSSTDSNLTGSKAAATICDADHYSDGLSEFKGTRSDIGTLPTASYPQTPKIPAQADDAIGTLNQTGEPKVEENLGENLHSAQSQSASTRSASAPPQEPKHQESTSRGNHRMPNRARSSGRLSSSSNENNHRRYTGKTNKIFSDRRHNGRHFNKFQEGRYRDNICSDFWGHGDSGRLPTIPPIGPPRPQFGFPPNGQFTDWNGAHRPPYKYPSRQQGCRERLPGLAAYPAGVNPGLLKDRGRRRTASGPAENISRATGHKGRWALSRSGSGKERNCGVSDYKSFRDGDNFNSQCSALVGGGGGWTRPNSGQISAGVPNQTPGRYSDVNKLVGDERFDVYSGHNGANIRRTGMSLYMITPQTAHQTCPVTPQTAHQTCPVTPQTAHQPCPVTPQTAHQTCPILPPTSDNVNLLHHGGKAHYIKNFRDVGYDGAGYKASDFKKGDCRRHLLQGTDNAQLYPSHTWHNNLHSDHLGQAKDARLNDIAPDAVKQFSCAATTLRTAPQAAPNCSFGSLSDNLNSYPLTYQPDKTVHIHRFQTSPFMASAPLPFSEGRPVSRSLMTREASINHNTRTKEKDSLATNGQPHIGISYLLTGKSERPRWSEGRTDANHSKDIPANDAEINLERPNQIATVVNTTCSSYASDLPGPAFKEIGQGQTGSQDHLSAVKVSMTEEINEEMARAQKMSIPMNVNLKDKDRTLKLNPEAHEFSPTLIDHYGKPFIMHNEGGVCYFRPKEFSLSSNPKYVISTGQDGSDGETISHTNYSVDNTETEFITARHEETVDPENDIDNDLREHFQPTQTAGQYFQFGQELHGQSDFHNTETIGNPPDGAITHPVNNSPVQMVPHTYAPRQSTESNENLNHQSPLTTFSTLPFTNMHSTESIRTFQPALAQPGAFSTPEIIEQPGIQSFPSPSYTVYSPQPTMPPAIVYISPQVPPVTPCYDSDCYSLAIQPANIHSLTSSAPTAQPCIEPYHQQMYKFPMSTNVQRQCLDTNNNDRLVSSLYDYYTKEGEHLPANPTVHTDQKHAPSTPESLPSDQKNLSANSQSGYDREVRKSTLAVAENPGESQVQDKLTHMLELVQKVLHPSETVRSHAELSNANYTNEHGKTTDKTIGCNRDPTLSSLKEIITKLLVLNKNSLWDHTWKNFKNSAYAKKELEVMQLWLGTLFVKIQQIDRVELNYSDETFAYIMTHLQGLLNTESTSPEQLKAHIRAHSGEDFIHRTFCKETSGGGIAELISNEPNMLSISTPPSSVTGKSSPVKSKNPHPKSAAGQKEVSATNTSRDLQTINSVSQSQIKMSGVTDRKDVATSSCVQEPLAGLRTSEVAAVTCKTQEDERVDDVPAEDQGHGAGISSPPVSVPRHSRRQVAETSDTHSVSRHRRDSLTNIVPTIDRRIFYFEHQSQSSANGGETDQ